MADYQLTATDQSVIRTEDQAFIPNDPANRDWAEYQDWLAGGGVPDPYVPPPEPEPQPDALAEAQRANARLDAGIVAAEDSVDQLVKLTRTGNVRTGEFVDWDTFNALQAQVDTLQEAVAAMLQAQATEGE